MAKKVSKSKTGSKVKTAGSPSKGSAKKKVTSKAPPAAKKAASKKPLKKELDKPKKVASEKPKVEAAKTEPRTSPKAVKVPPPPPEMIEEALVEEKASEPKDIAVPSTMMKKPKKTKGKKGASHEMLLSLQEGADGDKKWVSLYEKSKNRRAPLYDMKESYEAKTPIQHKVLGWGYILANVNDRLEVLFKDGVKYLISNYKRG